jgi:AAA+ ATPase superfamily predicted ATPase
MTNEIIVILGRKGCGKTTLLRKFVSEKKRVIFFDPIGQFSDGVIIVDPLSLLRFLQINCEKQYRIIYNPDPDSYVADGLLDDTKEKDYIKRHFAALCEIVRNLYNVYFAVDEVDLVTRPGECPNSFRSIIAHGRHSCISIVATTRRQTETSRLLTSQADVLISFEQHEPADIKYLATFFGEKADGLRTLEKYTYLEWKNGKTYCRVP